MVMMHSTAYKLSEFFIIFILVPVSFVLDFSIWIKLTVSIIGFLYIIYVLLKIENKRLKLAKHINWNIFFKNTMLKLLVIVIITVAFVFFFDKANLFKVLINKPLKWVVLLFIYSIFSVYPQELIFRTFYFSRYDALFQNKKVFLFINAVVFSLAHLFFRNALVIILTFLGGLLFAFTYKKTKSTLLVTIEHAIYGCWLFTVGMGDMLGFPS